MPKNNEVREFWYTDYNGKNTSPRRFYFIADTQLGGWKFVHSAVKGFLSFDRAGSNLFDNYEDCRDMCDRMNGIFRNVSKDDA